MKIRLRRNQKNERAVYEYNQAIRQLFRDARNISLGRAHINDLIINYNMLVDSKNDESLKAQTLQKEVAVLDDEIKRALKILATVERGSADYLTIEDGIKERKANK